MKSSIANKKMLQVMEVLTAKKEMDLEEAVNNSLSWGASLKGMIDQGYLTEEEIPSRIAPYIMPTDKLIKLVSQFEGLKAGEPIGKITYKKVSESFIYKEIMQDDGQGKAWLMGQYNDEFAYSNGHFLLKGEPPYGERVLEGGRFDIIEKDPQARRRCRPVMYTRFFPSYRSLPRVFFDDMRSINGYYYTYILSRFPDVSFWTTDGYNDMFVLLSEACIVGMVMLMRDEVSNAPDNLEKMIEDPLSQLL